MGKDGVVDLLSAENKLDGSNNYPLWSYMMKHILVANGLSKIVDGTEVRPGTRATPPDDDSATTSIVTYGRRVPPPPQVPPTVQNAFLWVIALRAKATGCTTQVHGRLF